MLLDEHRKRGEPSNGHEVEGQKVRPTHRQCFEQRVDFLNRFDGHPKAFGRGQSATRDELDLGLASLISEPCLTPKPHRPVPLQHGCRTRRH